MIESSVFIFFIMTMISYITFCSKVWAIADSKRQGYLGFKEFVTAMQVVVRILSI